MDILKIYPTQFLSQYIDHSSSLLADSKDLCMNPDFADITFVIRGQRFPAHRVILASRFDYFRVMLYGGFREATKREIELDVNPDAFRVILNYVYSGVLNLKLYTEEALAEVLHLANEYCFDELISVLLPTLCKRFNQDNYGVLMNVGRLYSQDIFYNVFLEILDESAEIILQKECFQLLNKEALADILKRDTFRGYELNIFKAVMKWSEAHDEEELKYVIPHIRFNLMQIDELRTHVQPTGILTESEINEIISRIRILQRFTFRAGETHRIQQNYITLVPKSVYGDALTIPEPIQRRGTSYFKFQRERMINHLFLDLSESVCSYHVEVSHNCIEWTKIIDYSKYKCYAQQFLYFDLLPVCYICIVPHHMEKGYYRIDKIESDYKFSSVPMLFDSFVAPIYNMHRAMSGLRDGWKYDSDSELTTLSKNITDAKSMTFSLHQPLHINSLQLKSEHRKFRVSKIESAVDENYFTELSYESDTNKCFSFEAHLVSFLRITFSRRPNPGKPMRIIFYFNPGKSAGPHSNWAEYLAETKRTGEFL